MIKCKGLILTCAFLLATAALVYCRSTITNARTRAAKAFSESAQVQARWFAEAAFERAVQELLDIRRRLPFEGALTAIDNLGQPLIEKEQFRINDKAIGSFRAALSIVAKGSNFRDVQIDCEGRIEELSGTRSASVSRVVRIERRVCKAFDYAYFTGSWGSWYGKTLVARGSVGANGPFAFAGYSPRVDGIPRFQTSTASSISGYIDDNGDGKADGNDGGVYSGWAITGADRIAGRARSIHPWRPRILLPSGKDLLHYEKRVKTRGGKLTVGGKTIVENSFGLDEGDSINLYISGTQEDPIVIDGVVFVRGHVVIKGVVSGRGAIVASGNIYIAGNIVYSTPPPVPPLGASESDYNAYLSKSDVKNADALALIAGEDLVFGDYTDTAWQNAVSRRLADPIVTLREDAGLDNLPESAAGRDGIPGTADDDLLEGDGEWTAARYTAGDVTVGILPAGKRPGDILPGSGEDLDGDGLFDDSSDVSEFYIGGDSRGRLNPDEWINLPEGIFMFNALSTSKIETVQAACFCARFAAGRITSRNPRSDFTLFGTLICGSDALVHTVKTCIFRYDVRLAGGGAAFGDFLPAAWAPVRILDEKKKR
ncbi:MAG: hypothetical protein E3J72_20765 [Planctomycetota bacterium]|nr:MAG: hypothetical protein E3J72_20765 [Planctomycetota bacterium]